MARLPPSDDTRFWCLATCSLIGFFMLQFIFLVIAVRAIDSDDAGDIFGGFLAAAIAGIIVAVLLHRNATGAIRGVSLAATTTAGIWVVSAVIVGCLYYTTT